MIVSGTAPGSPEEQWMFGGLNKYSPVSDPAILSVASRNKGGKHRVQLRGISTGCLRGGITPGLQELASRVQITEAETYKDMMSNPRSSRGQIGVRSGKAEWVM